MQAAERGGFVALFNAGVPLKEISVYAGRHVDTIGKWIKRMQEGKVLYDRSRSGCPRTFTETEQLKITAFFCQANPLPGCNSITLKWAAEYFNGDLSFLGRNISVSSIGRILRRHSLKPHLHKYFLQITDPNFFDILPLIVELYLHPPQYLFCFDECPGIQILRRTAPPLPPGGGKTGGKYSEPNYSRNGTKDLYAFFDVNSGKVFGECTDDHKVGTLIEVFKKHVASLPGDEVIHYICDNLSNHSCHEFCRVVAEMCSVEYREKELKTKEQRQKWLQSTEDKRIVFHFTPKHGSWLNMVEIWFGIMGQKCLKHNSFESAEKLVSFLHDFIRIWNEHFAHPFNWTYDGAGLHEKAVHRLIKHISIENEHMELSFLLGQIELMLNLLNGYSEQVGMKDWCLLAETIDKKMDYLNAIMENSDKPIVKKKAEKLFPELIKKLNGCIPDRVEYVT